ncbi:phage tail assembly chaperone G [Paenibacillus ehimensis]|uniref:Uncharacterized protein n=1 Tax=Paenibacillus ehimensis TaxID=79264 RepID=A0ABT8VHH2_9BACL|nr:hypothetical protein [Paenibacillus ehimensis]MDO3680432.1 hypothetical protein [Paenibacillus ehimensis]
MEIVLRVEGEEKTFTQDFVSGRIFRKTLEMQKKIEGDIDVSTLDLLVDYVVELFGKQFTRDDFYDGIEAKRLIPTIVGCIQSVVGVTAESVGADPNAPNS